jgi:hypothetical protein
MLLLPWQAWKNGLAAITTANTGLGAKKAITPCAWEKLRADWKNDLQSCGSRAKS